MEDHYQYKVRSQSGYIIRAMLAQPDRWFLAADFCGRDKSLPFIGYKAPTRIAEMQKAGMIISRWSKIRTVTGSKMKEYMLNKDRFDFSERDRMVEAKLKREIRPNALFDADEFTSGINPYA